MSIFSPLCDDIVDFGTHNSNARKNTTYNPSGKVVKITPHHMAMVCDAKRCAQAHRSGDKASATYYIGNDGKICGGVSEDRRPWTSSSRENDFLAVTIEVSNSDTTPRWPVSDAAFASLVRLCVDICKRNGLELYRRRKREPNTPQYVRKYPVSGPVPAGAVPGAAASG